MEWTDIRLTVSKADAEAAEAVATMIAEGGIYIEDYSDIEEQVEQIAHVDLIEQELLDKPRDTVIIHMYLEPGDSPVETLALIAARMEAAGIPYTSETEGVEQEDWQNDWRKYYHPMDVGQRLAVVPSWQDYETSRVKLILDPGLAFGTGGHETTNLCLEVLDERVRGGERVLDIGTGSGILAIAALKLGASRRPSGHFPGSGCSRDLPYPQVPGTSRCPRDLFSSSRRPYPPWRCGSRSVRADIFHGRLCRFLPGSRRLRIPRSRS